MKATPVDLGSLDPGMVSSPWVVVLGGVTRKGNRRARRAASRALGLGLDVVWFDGYEERHPETGLPVPIKAKPTDGAKAVVVGFKNRESATFSARLRASNRTGRANPVSRVWDKIGRRIGNILRARACWSVVREDVKRLREVGEPIFIVFADDHMLTSAWYAGRFWKSAAICSSLPVR